MVQAIGSWIKQMLGGLRIYKVRGKMNTDVVPRLILPIHAFLSRSVAGGG